MPVIDGDLFSPRIRLSRCDVRTIEKLNSLFRHKTGLKMKSRTLSINIVQP